MREEIYYNCWCKYRTHEDKCSDHGIASKNHDIKKEYENNCLRNPVRKFCYTCSHYPDKSTNEVCGDCRTMHHKLRGSLFGEDNWELNPDLKIWDE